MLSILFDSDVFDNETETTFRWHLTVLQIANVIAEYVWRCQLRQFMVKASAVMLATMSVAIVMAEATLMFEADLSLFSLILRGMGESEILVQVSPFSSGPPDMIPDICFNRFRSDVILGT